MTTFEDALTGKTPARHPMAESIIDIAFQSTAETLASHGAVGAPTLHLFCEDQPQPYAGYVSTRPFYRRADAATAIIRLGLLPSVLAATRVVIVWEHADLLTALTEPHQGYPHALAAVEATLTGHTLIWRPFTLTSGADDPRTGLPSSTPSFSPTEHLPNAALPQPVAGALSLWRQLRRDDLETTVRALLAEGFTVRLTQPS